MIRRSRTAAQSLIVFAAAISAGCAQMSGTYTAGDPLPNSNWPTPSVNNTPAPTPPEPTHLPQVVKVPPLPTPTQLGDAASASKHAKPTVRRAAQATTTAKPQIGSSQAADAAEPRDIWQRVRNGFQMAHFENSLVSDWENYYASRGEYFGRMVNNASHFLFHIVTQVERRNMPLEIALLPMIESAFNPVAYSHAHASGIWQFIPSTGRNYGLRQSWWYDGRRDVIAATDAALEYLQTLHGMFNDWELALAAYNWGEGAVQRAIDRNRARGLPTDYQSLYPGMPAETRNYVPKLIAVKNIIANPARFGLTLAPVPNEPYFEVVALQRHIDVARAAQFANMSLEEFRFLNPAHNKRVINSNVAQTVVLPKNRVTQFNANMHQHENQPLASKRTHTVRAGERPETIAAQYGISVEELNRLNNFGGRRQIATGQTILVPNSELQPVLDDNPAFAPVAASAAATRTVMQRVVVTRGGAAPARATANAKARPGPVPLHTAVRRGGATAQATNPAARPAAKPAARPAAKPRAQSIAFQAPAPAKAKR